jgi:hypothetical protein
LGFYAWKGISAAAIPVPHALLIGGNNARLAGRGVGDAAAPVAMLYGGSDLGGYGKEFIGRAILTSTLWSGV